VKLKDSPFKPIYTTFDSVKVRLTNKVQFQDGDEPQEGEVPNLLLGQIVVDAEADVESDLSSRYAIPFQSKQYGNFAQLPEHTKSQLRRACDLRAVELVLMTDFGRGTHTSGKKYSEDDMTDYEKHIQRLLGRDAIGRNDKIDRHKVSPPLLDLVLAPNNSEADDGYRGTVINTDGSRHDAATYAGEQINNPAGTYLGRRRIR
jgi:hypothetical protein